MIKFLLESGRRCKAGAKGRHRPWYPDVLADDLESTTPHSIELLGQHLVLNGDAEKQ